jgi:hypothetical protein
MSEIIEKALEYEKTLEIYKQAKTTKEIWAIFEKDEDWRGASKWVPYLVAFHELRIGIDEQLAKRNEAVELCDKLQAELKFIRDKVPYAFKYMDEYEKALTNPNKPTTEKP